MPARMHAVTVLSVISLIVPQKWLMSFSTHSFTAHVTNEENKTEASLSSLEHLLDRCHSPAILLREYVTQLYRAKKL